MGTKPAKSSRPSRPRVPRSTKLPSNRKRRDERLVLQLMGAESAAIVAMDARSTDSHFQMHMQRHVVDVIRDVILTLTAGTCRWGKDNVPKVAP